MHGVKTVVYQHYITLDREFWFLAGLLGIAMILGTSSASESLFVCLKTSFSGSLARVYWWQSPDT